MRSHGSARRSRAQLLLARQQRLALGDPSVAGHDGVVHGVHFDNGGVHGVLLGSKSRSRGHPSPVARVIRSNPAPATTAPTAWATRPPARARRSTAMAGAPRAL